MAYPLPPTDVLGAILLTSNVGFPVMIGVLVCTGMVLRKARLQDLISLRH